MASCPAGLARRSRSESVSQRPDRSPGRQHVPPPALPAAQLPAAPRGGQAAGGAPGDGVKGGTEPGVAPLQGNATSSWNPRRFPTWSRTLAASRRRSQLSGAGTQGPGAAAGRARGRRGGWGGHYSEREVPYQLHLLAARTRSSPSAFPQRRTCSAAATNFLRGSCLRAWPPQD